MKSAGGCITCEDARLWRWRGHGGILYVIARIAIMVVGGGIKMRYWLAVLLFASAASVVSAAPKFELRDGDRVVFIGNTFVERDIQYNYLETLLTIAYADRKVTFRNMGWSG